jgi:hypothetical protein
MGMEKVEFIGSNPLRSSSDKKAIKLGALINQLETISIEHGDDIDVCFDTEAAEFDVHLINVSSANYLGEDMVPEEMVCLTTNEYGNHCGQHKITEINNEKVSHFLVCTRCGKLFDKASEEDVQEFFKKANEYGQSAG